MWSPTNPMRGLITGKTPMGRGSQAPTQLYNASYETEDVRGS